MKTTFILVLLIAALAAPAHAQIVVIAHPSVPVATIDTETLVDIYMLSRTKWSNGTPIRVLALKKGSMGAEKFYSVLGLNPLSLNKQWLRIQLTGEGRAPSLVTEDEIVAHVAATPGAIGFVDASRVTDKVKVLRQVTQ